MKRFNIRQVEAFRAVVTLGSMTKAAELLGISQPAVSRLMLDLQEAVGFKLFRRQRNGTEPTDDARRLFEQVEKLFVGLEELNQTVHAISTLGTGLVSTAAMGLYANGLLPDLIARFHQTHPDIAFRIEALPQDRVTDWVSARRSDMGFVTLPIGNTQIGVRELMRSAAMCVLPADHPLAARSEVRAEDMADLTFVSFPRGTPFRFEVDLLFQRAGIERVMMFEAAAHETVCNMVEVGLGVSIVSPFSPHLRRNPKLAFRPFRPAIPIVLGLVGEPDGMSVAARHFFDFVVTHFEARNAARAAQAAGATGTA